MRRLTLVGVLTFIITTFFASVPCKIYDRCELARELRDVHEIPQHQLATWICIAKHESHFNTSAMNPGSGDHGIFQISELFWCSPPGYACGVPCHLLRDEDLEDDVICARRIFREHKILSGEGFNAWVVYNLHCKDPHYVQTMLDDCFEEDGRVIKTDRDGKYYKNNEIITEDVREETTVPIEVYETTTTRSKAYSYFWEKDIDKYFPKPKQVGYFWLNDLDRYFPGPSKAQTKTTRLTSTTTKEPTTEAAARTIPVVVFEEKPIATERITTYKPAFERMQSTIANSISDDSTDEIEVLETIAPLRETNTSVTTTVKPTTITTKASIVNEEEFNEPSDNDIDKNIKFASTPKPSERSSVSAAKAFITTKTPAEITQSTQTTIKPIETTRKAKHFALQTTKATTKSSQPAVTKGMKTTTRPKATTAQLRLTTVHPSNLKTKKPSHFISTTQKPLQFTTKPTYYTTKISTYFTTTKKPTYSTTKRASFTTKAVPFFGGRAFNYVSTNKPFQSIKSSSYTTKKFSPSTRKPFISSTTVKPFASAKLYGFVTRSPSAVGFSASSTTRKSYVTSTTRKPFTTFKSNRFNSYQKNVTQFPSYFLSSTVKASNLGTTTSKSLVFRKNRKDANLSVRFRPAIKLGDYSLRFSSRGYQIVKDI